jgi:hypothetical protein
MFKCPAYDDADGNPKCLIYNDRPGVCSLFPLDEKDLRDRDFVMADKKCGFYFDDAPPGDGSGGERRVSMPLRWGPPKPGEPGEPARTPTGTLAILWSFVSKPTTDGNGSGKP